MDFQQSQSVSRDFVEKNMIFLGFLIVKNKLKEATQESLIKYDNADIRMVMATGDNIFTAICVAKECDLIKNNQVMYSCEFINGDNNQEIIKWKKIEGENNDSIDNKKMSINDSENGKNSVSSKNSTLSFTEIYPPEQVKNDMQEKSDRSSKIYTKRLSKNIKINLQEDEELNEEDKHNKLNNTPRISDHNINYSLYEIDENELNISDEDNNNFGVAMTGNTFEKLYKLNEKYEKKKINAYKNIHECFRKILKNGRVFARMVPEHKALLVESFKKEGLIT